MIDHKNYCSVLKTGECNCQHVAHLVQEIYRLDPLQVLVERRVRTELQAESAKKPL